jgi:hypothetical protein
MDGDKKRFTNAMRKARGPNSPPGESTKVNGQEVTTSAPPRTVTAWRQTPKIGGHDFYWWLSV